MWYCAVLALLGALALCPAAHGRSALIGLSGDDTRHGIEVLYGNLGGNQVELSRYHADTLIQTRFARTVIEIEIRNNGPATNTTVPFAIPENAMLVTFEIDDSNGKVHQARPMLRDAIVIDSKSTSSKIQARNAEAFDVEIQLEGSGSVVLRVVYEELLTRKREKYTNVQQIWPGQTVADLKLTVRIKESSPINSVNFTFSTESANSVVTTSLDQLMSVANVSDSEVHLTLQPTERQQQELARSLGQDPAVGAAGQFNVKYDVARYPTAGDVVVRDGFFAHFFAPSQLKSIPKYALFLLDVSGSMQGRKIQQLTDAMVAILGQLGADDVFTVIEFSDRTHMWDLAGSDAGTTTTPSPASCNIYSSEYITAAQERATDMAASGGTEMLDGLKQAIACAGSNVAGREPILVMLTDGVPDESTDQILDETAADNSRNGDPNDLVTSIFTLALGDDADIGFLSELALRNGGKFEQIYESGDASEQLQDFYDSISSPLLTDVTVTFNYQQAVEESVTQRDFRTFFRGSELVVAGRILPGQGDLLSGLVTATGYGGQNVTYPIQVTAQPSWQPESLGGQANSERLWAFLYTKQHLDQEVLDGPTSAAANASIDMALLYSFVTPHTCVAVDIFNPYIAPTLPPQPTTTSPAWPTTHPAPTGSPATPSPPAPTGSPTTPSSPAPTGSPATPSPPAPTGFPTTPTPPAPTGFPTTPSPPAPTGFPTTPSTPAPTRSPATPSSPAPTGPPATPSPSAPTGSTPSQRPSTPVGPPTPPTPGNSGRSNIINIGSISVGSMTVNGPLIQFNLRR